MKVCLSVEVGNGKSECEDTAVFNEIMINGGKTCVEADELCCVGVADGVGGSAGGRIAGRYVANQLSKANFSVMSETEIRDIISDINAELVNYAGEIPGKSEMATTLTCVVAASDGYYLIHAGNTRLYVMQGSYLKQLTTDHTTYNWMLASGQYEAAERCNKSEINCCLGGGNTRYAERLVVEKVFDDFPDTIVLTSDGIHEYADIDFIELALNESKNDSEAAQLIIEKAIRNGSEDDKTVIILRR